ncbi:MAG: hypothetical protein K8R89_07065 [Anaerolineae bacterium]|nr:hypothetical protein [Anaerolineae bacterium]
MTLLSEIFNDEFVPYVVFIAVILTALAINKLRQEVRELKEILQQRLPPEAEVTEVNDL